MVSARAVILRKMVNPIATVLVAIPPRGDLHSSGICSLGGIISVPWIILRSWRLVVFNHCGYLLHVEVPQSIPHFIIVLCLLVVFESTVAE